MLAFAALLIALGGASSAEATPRVLSVDLPGGAFVGRTATLKVSAVDPSSPVSGMVFRVGDESAYATSACRMPTPFPANTAVRLAAPAEFTRTGSVDSLIRVDAAGCEAPSGSVVEPVTVTPVRPGEKPHPLVLGIPLPTLPNVTPPSLPGGITLPLASLSRSCPGAHRRPGRTVKARRRAIDTLLCLINRTRQRSGLRAFKQSRRLRRAARWHSDSMVRRHYFSHVQPGGIGLVQRMRRVHYLPARRWVVGENIAAGTGRLSTPAIQLLAWLASTPHRLNLLNRHYRQIGLGVAPGYPTSRGGATYTADFGVRR